MNRGNKPRHSRSADVESRNAVSLDDYLMERKVQSLYFDRITEDELAPKDSALKLAIIDVAKGAKRASKSAAHKSLTNLKKVSKQGSAKLPFTKKTPQSPVAQLAESRRAKQRRFSKKQLAVAFGSMALIALPILEFGVLRPNAISKKFGAGSKVLGSSEERSNGTPISVPINQDPPFATLLPEGKTASDVGGFAKVSASDSAPAYAFVDKIGDLEVQVTQQQLPESFKTNTSAEVEKMAIGFNATEAVKTDKLEFFVGTSIKGAQSVITYKKGLLLFLKSTVKISNDKWSRYITDLQ